MSIALSTPGMRSRFSRNSGTQNEWFTSSVRNTKCTGRSTGTSIVGGLTSPAPSTTLPCSGNSNRQPHWKPVTFTTSASSAGVVFVTSSCVATLNPNRAGDDHDRRDRVEHLDRDVVRLLAGDVVVLPPEADGGVEDQADDETEHHESWRRRTRSRASRCAALPSRPGRASRARGPRSLRARSRTRGTAPAVAPARNLPRRR